MIESVTSANLIEVGDDQLLLLIEYCDARINNFNLSSQEKDLTAKIKESLLTEKLRRSEIKLIGCPWLTLQGECRHLDVTSKYGAHQCPKLKGRACTLKRIKNLSRF